MARSPKIVNGIPEPCDCLNCRIAWEDEQEALYALRLLAAQGNEIRQAKPATDAEWQAFLFGEWPRAKKGVTL